jgi:hypothetical protein
VVGMHKTVGSMSTLRVNKQISGIFLKAFKNVYFIYKYHLLPLVGCPGKCIQGRLLSPTQLKPMIFAF